MSVKYVSNNTLSKLLFPYLFYTVNCNSLVYGTVSCSFLTIQLFFQTLFLSAPLSVYYPPILPGKSENGKR